MKGMYKAAEDRYAQMTYRRCGKSGLLLPELSLGMWQHFSDAEPYADGRDIILKAFDSGITHFDLANNYGGGSAEENFGKILAKDLAPYRDELIISTKAGYDMWSGPYGEWGSRKYLIASLDRSLKRMGLDYVDIFYSHRPDHETPLEETMGALAHAVHQGKALYAGISNYPADMAEEAVGILASKGVRCLIHQPKYSMLERTPEKGLLDVLERNGVGSIVFQPLAQGLLTDKYLKGIPADSRISNGKGSIMSSDLTPDLLSALKELNSMALERGQSLAQMAISWLLKDRRVTSVLIGVSRISQLTDNLKALENKNFSSDELDIIENILKRCQNKQTDA